MSQPINSSVMSDLKTFIDEQRSKQTSAKTVDWTQRREKWIGELEKLFAWIKARLIDAGLEDQAMQLTLGQLSEESLGTYEAPSLWIKLPGGADIGFIPVASVVVGGYGRVDVVSRLGSNKVMLIASDPEGDFRAPQDQTPAHQREWTWRVFPARTFQGSYPLDEAGLTKLLSHVAS